MVLHMPSAMTTSSAVFEGLVFSVSYTGGALFSEKMLLGWHQSCPTIFEAQWCSG